jgi:large repetitive protein
MVVKVGRLAADLNAMGSVGPIRGLCGRRLPRALAVVLIAVLGSDAWTGIAAATTTHPGATTRPAAPTAAPTPAPMPSASPTPAPSTLPTVAPSVAPTVTPTLPTATPTASPSAAPIVTATPTVTASPTVTAVSEPSASPTPVSGGRQVVTVRQARPVTPTVTAVEADGFSLTPGFTVVKTAGDTLSCSVTGPAGGPTVTVRTCTRAAVLDLTGGDPGTYTLSVTQTGSGASSLPGSGSYVLEPSPTITADSPFDTSASPTFTVSDYDDVATTLECTVTGPGADPSPAVVTTCGDSDAVDLDIGSGGDGTYTVTIDATDSDGNVSGSTSASYEYEPDPPPAPVVIAPLSPGNSRGPVFSVSDTENVNLTYTCSLTVPSGQPNAPSLVSTCGAPSAVLNLNGAQDGTYTLSVTATDELGDVSDAGFDSYTLDASTDAPNVTQLTPAAGVYSDPAPTFSIGDGESGDAFSCVWAGPSGRTLTGGACQDGDSFDATAGDGVYSLTVTAADSLGNSVDPSGNPASTTVAYKYDVTTPAPTVMLAPDQSSPSSSSTPTFTISDAESLDGPDTFECVWQQAGDASPLASGACGVGTVSPSFAASEGDGVYTLAVTATDQLGNSVTDAADPADSPATTTVSYVLDTTTPEPTIGLAGAATTPSADASPTFAIADSESVDGPDSYRCVWGLADAVPAPPSVACGRGANVSARFAASSGDGVYALTVTATDSLGNAVTDAAGDPATATTSYTLDSTTPAPTVTLTGPSPSKATTATFAISDTESVDGPDSYSCVWTSPTDVVRPAGTPCGSGASVVDNIAANAGDGLYTLTVTASDTLGNNTDNTAGNPAATTATYRLDTTTPAPTVALTAGETSPSSLASPRFVISDADAVALPVSYSCVWQRQGDATPLSNGPCGRGATVIDQFTASEGDGIYSLAVDATDALGNAVTDPGGDPATTTLTYRLDSTTSAPSVSLFGGSGSPSRNVTPTFRIADAEQVSLPESYLCQWTGPGGGSLARVAVPCSDGQGFTADQGDGTYTLTVTASDSLGNAVDNAGQPTSTTIAYVLDTSTPVPIVTPTIPVATVSVSNDTSPIVAVSDAETVDGPDQFSCAWTDPLGVVITTPCVAGPNTFALPLHDDGLYTFSVTATDTLGNTATSAPLTYDVDTTAPDPPDVEVATAHRSSNTDPTWTWHLGVNDQTDTAAVATCQLIGPPRQSGVGWGLAPAPCGHTFAATLAGGDGIYTLVVTLTDPAGNVSQTGSATYRLDSSAPDGPTVRLLHPSGGVGLDRQPVWSVTGPPNTTLECTLVKLELRGTTVVHRSVVVPQTTCTAPQTYDLAGMSDGLYMLRVVGVDSAGVSSFAAVSKYVLAPTAPRVVAPHGQRADAVWTVEGNPADGAVCTLSSQGVVVSSTSSCGTHPRYAMAERASGRYTLSVVQIGAEQVHSQAGTASWEWHGVRARHPSGGAPPRPTGPVSAPRQHHHRRHQQSVRPVPIKAPVALSRIHSDRRRLHVGDHHAVAPSNPVPPRPPSNPLGHELSAAGQHVAQAVSAAVGHTGFPLLLIALVLMFLVAQNLIDRRDPKLALASIGADDMVEFRPPPSRRDWS